MFLVVSYDIVDDKKRAKIANILKDYGRRVQYSVFECELSKKVLRKMVKELLEHVELEKDSIRLYGLCRGCKDNIEAYGIGTCCTIDEGPIVI